MTPKSWLAMCDAAFVDPLNMPQSKIFQGLVKPSTVYLWAYLLVEIQHWDQELFNMLHSTLILSNGVAYLERLSGARYCMSRPVNRCSSYKHISYQDTWSRSQTCLVLHDANKTQFALQNRRDNANFFNAITKPVFCLENFWQNYTLIFNQCHTA